MHTNAQSKKAAPHENETYSIRSILAFLLTAILLTAAAETVIHIGDAGW